jgi:MYXO-CTERM domain-containing protein
MTDSERNRRSAPTDPAGIEEPHDVLAAEEFGIPTRDSGVPSDPTGIREPHDVLAAEEFAMPAGAESQGAAGGDGGRGVRAYLPLALGVLVLLLVLRRRR